MVNELVANSGDFKLFFEIVKEFATEAIVLIDQDEMNIRTLDTANVMMVDVNISNLKENSVDDVYEVGVNTEECYTVLNTIKGGDATLSLLDGKIQFSSGRWKVAIPTYDVATMRKRPGYPSNMVLPVELDITDKLFPDALKSISAKVDKVKISSTLNPDELLIIESFDERLEWRVAFDSEGVEVVKQEREVRSYMSADYLKSIGSILPKLQDISICLGQDQPLVIRGVFQGGDSTVEYILAPRVGLEEE